MTLSISPMEPIQSLETNDGVSRIWEAFDAGVILAACAWCGRVRIDETWLRPSRAALVAIDQRFAFSHSICEDCADALGHARLHVQGAQ